MAKTKKIYLKNVVKWALATGGVSGILLFAYLSSIGAIVINSYDYSKVCADCWATVNFTAKDDVLIYPSENWSYMFYTDKRVNNLTVYINSGGSFKKIDFNKTYDKNVKYALKLSKGKNYVMIFTAQKINPHKDIKWGFGKLDPVWEGIPTYIPPSSDNITLILYPIEDAPPWWNITLILTGGGVISIEVNGYSSFNFRPITIDQKGVNCTNISPDFGCLNVTNNGTDTVFQVTLKMNESAPSGYTMKCANNAGYIDQLILTTTEQVIWNQALAVGESFYVWCRMDYDKPTKAWKAKLQYTPT